MLDGVQVNGKRRALDGLRHQERVMLERAEQIETVNKGVVAGLAASLRVAEREQRRASVVDKSERLQMAKKVGDAVNAFETSDRKRERFEEMQSRVDKRQRVDAAAVAAPAAAEEVDEARLCM